MRRTTKIQLALLDNLVWVMVAVFFIINLILRSLKTADNPYKYCL